MNTAEVISSFRANGKKVTKVRRETLEIVFGASKPLTAPEILQQLNEKGISLNKTTLYRELSFLLKEKILSEVRLNSYVHHYEPAHLEHHHHLVCDSCGKVQEIASKELENSMKKMDIKASVDGFKIRDHQLEFYGLCSNCN